MEQIIILCDKKKTTKLKEAPPEVFDNRTLYDKLKEQNDIKKAEFESQYALSWFLILYLKYSVLFSSIYETKKMFFFK
jgi:hypothetical protein